jgi:ABC-type transport system involved in multi-copper enzyme maturation permease subunit
MSVLFSRCLAWTRRNLSWSNSRQSWEERLGLAGLAAFAGLLAWLGQELPLSIQLLLWGALVLGAAALLRRGWLKLFGPVLFYDLVRIGRRARYFLFRTLYALLLFAILAWIYFVWFLRSDRGFIRATEMAEFAQTFFYTFMVVQFLAAVLLTPAYTAGAVADEKERKTLEFLLATDLRNREIVLSKLASRLANLFLFLLAGLPILCFLQFVGGVDPGLVLAGFAATGLAVLSLASLSVFNSVIARRSRDAIVVSYLAVIAYLALSGLSRVLLLGRLGIADFPSLESPVRIRDLVEWFSAGNPIVAIYHIFSGGPRLGANPEEVLPTVLRRFAAFHLLVAGVCATWAVVRLRAVAVKQTYGKSRRASLASRLRPGVFDLPMIWKEVFAESSHRFGWFGLVIVALLIVASLVPTGFIIADFIDNLRQYQAGTGPYGFNSGPWRDYFNPWRQLAREMNGFQVRFVGTCVACFMLLAVAVRAAGSITGERERQTLGSLLTTPLDSNAILVGKWLGSVLSVRWAWFWLGLIWLLGLVTGGLHILAMPGLVLSWVVYAAFLATLGMWFSTICRSSMRAVLSTVFTAAGLGFGHWIIWACLLPFFWAADERPDHFDWLWKLQFGITPPFSMGCLAFYGPEFENMNWDGNGPTYGGLNETAVQLTACSVLGICLWAGATCLLWVLTSHRLRKVTGRTPLRQTDRAGWMRLRRPAPRRVLDALPADPSPGRGAGPTGVMRAEELWAEHVWTEPAPPDGDGATGGQRSDGFVNHDPRDGDSKQGPRAGPFTAMDPPSGSAEG